MLEKTFMALGITGVLLVILSLFVIGPWLSILAINQLFSISIKLTFWNWLSAVWLHIIVANSSFKS
jgi:hypothetical protein